MQCVCTTVVYYQKMIPEFKINFILTQGIAYFIGKNIQTKRHEHHALEFIFGIDRPFDLLSDESELRKIYGVVIDPNYPHQFIGGDARYLFIYLEPELLPINQIKNYYALPFRKTVQIEKISSFPSVEEVINFSFFSDTLGITTTHNAIPETDCRIKNSVEYIKTNLEEEQISSNMLAEKTHLSTSRFCHLFKEQIGIPVRKFILWCRIQEALMELVRGGNFTESAHVAGFSDSAHFSRTFSKMFGVSPSSVLKR